nr:MAG TPA: hypothetical protein [Caudoviricetes sp.]DAV83971.1 MAG TPA: hypothetical protein [Caudoviricetes sp.]
MARSQSNSNQDLIRRFCPSLCVRCLLTLLKKVN